MSTEYCLPALPLGGADIAILRWLKAPGQPVLAGEPLLIALNDRVEAVLLAPSDGRVERVLVPAGASAAVGAAVAVLALGEPAPALSPTAPPARGAPSATPLARRIAAAHGLDLRGVAGGGPSGRVVAADVLAAVGADTPAPQQHAAPVPQGAPLVATFAPPDTAVLSAMEADMAMAIDACARLAPALARRGLAIEPWLCVAHAAVQALLSFPLLNGWWADERIVVPQRVHVRVEAPGWAGLIAEAQDLNLRGMARALAAGPADAPEGTFGIVAAGARFAQPYAPRCAAALTIGATQLRPVVRASGGADQIVARPIALLTLAYDARVADQARADAFLRDVVARVERYGAW